MHWMTSQYERTKAYRNTSKINLFSDYYQQPLTIYYLQDRMRYHDVVIFLSWLKGDQYLMLHSMPFYKRQLLNIAQLKLHLWLRITIHITNR